MSQSFSEELTPINFLIMVSGYFHICLGLGKKEVKIPKYVDENVLNYKPRFLELIKNEEIKKIASRVLDAYLDALSEEIHCNFRLNSIKYYAGKFDPDSPAFSDIPEFQIFLQLAIERCNRCPYKSIKYSGLSFNDVMK